MKILVSACVVLMPVAALAGAAPEDVLKRHGLVQANGLWHLTSDVSIAERVKTAERLERRFYERRNQIDTALEYNERMKTQLAILTEAQKTARALRNTVKDGSNERKLLDEQIKQQDAAIEQLKKSIVPVEKLGGSQPLKALVMELVGIRSETAYHLLGARRHIEQAPARYEALRTNPEIVAALAALQPPGQLAPLRTHANEMRSVERIEKVIFGDELPLFREGKHWRMTGIANEELPMTFTFSESSEPTVITHTMAEALGLELAKPPKGDRRIGNSNVNATRVRLTSLRFGRHVLKDVEVYVLPPDSENLRARIGPAAFKGLNVRIVAERLLLRLDPKEM